MTMLHADLPPCGASWSDELGHDRAKPCARHVHVVTRRKSVPSEMEFSVIARPARQAEAITAASPARVKRDCFAEFILGLAEGETRGLAMTLRVS
jgi:hypothetical protein